MELIFYTETGILHDTQDELIVGETMNPGTDQVYTDDDLDTLDICDIEEILTHKSHKEKLKHLAKEYPQVLINAIKEMV
jgi:hypothetical protein